MDLDTNKMRQIVDQAIEQHPRMHRMESDIGILKSDVSTLKKDLTTVKSDVATLKSEIVEVKLDISALKVEQHRQGLMIEHMDRKMDRLIDALLPAKHREVQIDRLEETTDSHEQRLGAVETVLKDHLSDRERHR